MSFVGARRTAQHSVMTTSTPASAKADTVDRNSRFAAL